MASNAAAVPHLKMLSHEQCETVHRASLEILRRTGVRVHHEGAVALLRQADVLITDTNLVRFPAGLVEWALNQAPSRIALCRRGSDRHLSQQPTPFETLKRQSAKPTTIWFLPHCDSLSGSNVVLNHAGRSTATVRRLMFLGTDVDPVRSQDRESDGSTSRAQNPPGLPQNLGQIAGEDTGQNHNKK